MILNLLTLTHNPMGNLFRLCRCHLPSWFSPSQLLFLTSTRRGWRRKYIFWSWRIM